LFIAALFTGYGIPVSLFLCGSALTFYTLEGLRHPRPNRPVRALIDQALAVAEQGDYSLRAQPLGRGELAELAAALNRLLDRAQREIAAMHELEKLRQEDRARLSAIIDSAMDAVISIDASQRITMFNAAAEKMFRCPAKEAIGQPLDRFIPARFRQSHHAHVAQFERSGLTSRSMGHLKPLTGQRADGEEFPMEASISHVEVGGQKISTAIVRDITRRMEAEEQIHKLNAELEQRVLDRTAELTAANKELEAFTCSVAHDLRAPLRHIDAYSKILLEEFRSNLPPEAQQYLESVRAGSRNMTQLVDDLLNLAHIGQLELKRQPVPLNTLVNEVREELTREFSGRTIEWHVRPLPVLHCDAGLMKQVFANLLSNAVKYTRQRPLAVIEVGCLKVNSSTAIFVRDNGVGFNMKYAHRLFGIFQRLHRAEDFEGTGVGLAIVERIIRRHGGCVWAESAVDKGAVFYFMVPGLESGKSA
jgi:PAS domain S-box-containing protein